MNRKLALITGGTSGIGLGIAESLGPEWDLALIYASNDAKASSALELLNSQRASHPEAKTKTYKISLSRDTDYSSLIDDITRDFGQAPSALVHSAGRIADELWLRADLEKGLRLVDEHLSVAMGLSQAALKSMYRIRFGRIVFMSSISANYAKRGQASYAAAKAGLESFAKTLALEVAHRGVTVNAIAPGLIETPMTRKFAAQMEEGSMPIAKRIPAGRMGQPKEVGALAAFLLSDHASYITGTTITIDGGRSLGDPLS